MTATPVGGALPTGTVTFLRTDVEGSMRLAASLGQGWDRHNDVQLGLIREAVAAAGGVVVRTEGDACFAAFADARAAVAAAIAIQRGLLAHPWPAEAPVRVRIGLHSGEAHLAGDDYGGFDVNRAARIAAVGHGGQIVASDATRALVEPYLADGVALRDIGRHVLKDVPHAERLFQVDAPGLETAFPPLRTAATASGNLPPRLTSFIGREGELAEALRLLGDVRLLTLTGPGGMGKTSLAVEVARAAAERFPDGAWFVDLAPLEHGDDVPRAVAHALGLREATDRPAGETVTRHLGERKALLVLDNFEHVLAAASFVAAVLRAAPGVRALVTSRAALRVAGEQELAVQPLSVSAAGTPGEAAEAPAVRLFLERARAVRPGWSAGQELAVVRELCERLDGLPLGIEIAAARVPLLSPTAIRDRLAAGMALPSAGLRDVPDRQRTLEHAIAWSHDLLGAAERQLFRRLAVFEDGFDIAQVPAVVEPLEGGVDVLDGVLALADQSLLVPDPRADRGGRLGGLRFRMLETIRVFARGRLDAAGETTAVLDRHAAAYLALAEAAAPHWTRVDQAPWLDRIAEDHANLRAALSRSIDLGRVEVAQRLAAALWRYWQFAGHLVEGRALAEQVATLRPDEPSPERMWALAAAGGAAYWQADSDVANRHYLEQLAVAIQVGDLAGEADACFNLSSTEFILGRQGRAVEYLGRARALYERLGDEVGTTRTVWAEHNVLVYQDRREEARPMLDGLHERFGQLGDGMYLGLSAGAMALISLLDGEIDPALTWSGRSLAQHHAMGDAATATITLAALAIGLVETGRPRAAAQLLGAYEALSDRFGVRPPAGLGYIISILRPVERTLELLHADEYAAANTLGRAMSLDEAVAFAMDAVAAARPEGPLPPGSAPGS